MKIKNAFLNTPNGIFVLGHGNQGPRLGPHNVDQTVAKNCKMTFDSGLLTVDFPAHGNGKATRRIIPVSSIDWMEEDTTESK